MLIDTHKQILVGTGMLGAVPASSSDPADGHCYCGEVTGLFIQPFEVREGEKVLSKFCLMGFTPAGQKVRLYIGDTLEAANRVFVAAFNEIMSPNGGAVTYLNIPIILQQLMQEAEAAQETEGSGFQPTEGAATTERVGPDGKINPRVFVPRKGAPVKVVEKPDDAAASSAALQAEPAKVEAHNEGTEYHVDP